jgi:glutamyl-tRNA reductase
MVVGEAQIQGQVRAAYELAQSEGVLTGPVMPRLFETALRVGGRIRSETRLGTGAASIPSAALELGRKIFGNLKGLSALVIGAGEMSELTVRCLRDEGVSDVSVVNRTEARAQELAKSLQARAISFAEIPAALATADIVVTATAAPHVVLTHALVERATAERDRPLLILDIALPRDVDASVAELDNVFLYDIDDLSQVVEGNLRRRHSEIDAAQAIVDTEVREFQEWTRGREAVPLIRDLRGWAEDVRAAEVAKAMRAMKHLSPSDQEAVEALTRQLTAKLLHPPTTRIRRAASAGGDMGVIETGRYLFGLDEESETK